MAEASAQIIRLSDKDQPGPRLVSSAPDRDASRQYWQAKFADGFRDMEGGLSQILLMSEVASDLVEQLFSARVDETRFDYTIPDREREHAIWAVSHLQAMIRRLSNQYHAVWDDKD